MKILFTGASSFTGMWFARELAEKGHRVATAFPRSQEAYGDLRKKRVEIVLSHSEPVFSCSFGSPSFLALIRSQKWDLFCHHAAEVGNYKSADFDFVQALDRNTKNLKQVLNALKEQGCTTLILTGSVFEQGEGQGSEGLRAVSPYGLSKGLTAEVFRYFCEISGFKLGKFVIPNPFGPYEESRFTTFLAHSWLQGRTPTVDSPDYVRDNIHVSLLAKAYRFFTENLVSNTSSYQVFRPAGYQESQGSFTTRFAKEMEKRLGASCPYKLGIQTLFLEPRIRLNTDSLDFKALGWDESVSWDQLADFYRTQYGHA